MYILNIAKVKKKIAVKELKDFIFENYYHQMGFAIESNYLMKHQKNIYIQLFGTKLTEREPDPRNAEEQYQSF